MCRGRAEGYRTSTGASSNTAWALVPPIPKLLISARRGASPRSHGSVSRLSRNGVFSKPIRGFGLLMFSVPGIRSPSSDMMTLIRPATLEAWFK
jgi:hypothetical protein